MGEPGLLHLDHGRGENLFSADFNLSAGHARTLLSSDTTRGKL